MKIHAILNDGRENGEQQRSQCLKTLIRSDHQAVFWADDGAVAGIQCTRKKSEKFFIARRCDSIRIVC